MIIMIRMSRYATNGPDHLLFIQRLRSNQILLSLSALITGFAFAISSLPTALKSKPHSCFSGYLWDPQNVIPHLHLNPVNPVLFLHVPHRFDWTGPCELSDASGTIDGTVNAGGWGWGRDSISATGEAATNTAVEADAEAEERAVSIVDLVLACSCSFKWMSL